MHSPGIEPASFGCGAYVLANYTKYSGSGYSIMGSKQKGVAVAVMPRRIQYNKSDWRVFVEWSCMITRRTVWMSATGVICFRRPVESSSKMRGSKFPTSVCSSIINRKHLGHSRLVTVVWSQSLRHNSLNELHVPDPSMRHNPLVGASNEYTS